MLIYTQNWHIFSSHLPFLSDCVDQQANENITSDLILNYSKLLQSTENSVPRMNPCYSGKTAHMRV